MWTGRESSDAEEGTERAILESTRPLTRGVLRGSFALLLSSFSLAIMPWEAVDVITMPNQAVIITPQSLFMIGCLIWKRLHTFMNTNDVMVLTLGL